MGDMSIAHPSCVIISSYKISSLETASSLGRISSLKRISSVFYSMSMLSILTIWYASVSGKNLVDLISILLLLNKAIFISDVIEVFLGVSTKCVFSSDGNRSIMNVLLDRNLYRVFIR